MLVFVGIDMSKDKSDLGWLRDLTTRKKKNKVIPNTTKGHKETAQWLLENIKTAPENIVVVMEPTNVYHENLMYYLNERGFKIFLVNPAKAKKFADSMDLVHKTDRVDSIALAHYGQAQQSRLKYWEPNSSQVRDLKGLMSRLNALEKDLQREKNRKESAEFNATSEGAIESLDESIEFLKQSVKKLEQKIDKHIAQLPTLKKNRELLETIGGVGPVMSRQMVYLFAAKKFNNAKSVAAYLGLIPQFSESGKYKGRTVLSKKGPAKVRAKLYMAAVAAGTHNPDIRSQKERLLRAGKTPMQAIGAAMRKLVQICFGVVNTQTVYEPQVS